MKTTALLQKYQTIIGSLAGYDAESIAFLVRRPGNMGTDVWMAIDSAPNAEKPDDRYDWCLGTYRVVKNPPAGVNVPIVEIASFKLYQMPHCCGIVVSCNAEVKPAFRNRRIGTVLNNLRQELGRELGYSLMLCTDVDTNVHQRQLLKTNGWRDLLAFVNRRTANKVIISAIGL